MSSAHPAAIVFDPVHDRAAPPSPCINICTMNQLSGLCDGCQRNIDEIAFWSSSTEAEKRAIWRSINQRRKRRAA
ncbi:MAG: DUF1289 domain-containing protein [Pseudomonadota bacterium]|nr:DUF1289 domain-containing protein [Pseudomonadota bacterium]